ncbi:DUF4179 domain-containing protein [Paenibacillus luteus]|uniref:DUF4179 domain-containing protein n=1 Tax=Paenibacillus luteus TaxID=2545753 RepID=UPI001144149A|nr:DUF4179 domain-containing protein [Paenibacillus luteus]
MEVIAAMNDDKTLIVYLTMRDLTGERIDKTMDLYNYSINGATMFTHELVHYDESTNTATIRMIANGGNKLNGKKVTVRVSSFLSDKQYFKDMETQVVLADVINYSPRVISLNMRNIPGGSGDLFPELEEKGIINILNVDEKSIEIPNIDFVKITNIGYVDGRLHIQTKWNDTRDDHGFLYLLNAGGDRIESSSVAFGIDEQGSTAYGREYLEYIYDIEPQEVSNYSLYGSFVKNNNYTEGKWATTFKIEAVDKSKRVIRDVELGNSKLDEITIQPLGIEIRGNIKDSDRFDIEATMDDGTKITYNHAVIGETNGETYIKYFPTSPTKIENIKELRINGLLVEL